MKNLKAVYKNVVTLFREYGGNEWKKYGNRLYSVEVPNTIKPSTIRFIPTALLFMFISLRLHAQNPFERPLPQSLPEAYQISREELHDQIKANIPQEYKTPKYERMMHRYADQQGYALSKYISGGALYTDWPELENYVNQVMRKVMPDHLKKHKGIHAYIVRNGSCNASMSASGAMYVHIGLFAQIDDEATLAAVLTHELAHFYCRHSMHTFFKEELKTWNSNSFRGQRKRNAFSQKHEMESDSLAAVWISQSPYDLGGVLALLKVLDRLQTRAIRKHPRDWELKATTHPLSEERLQQLAEIGKEGTPTNGVRFAVSEALFLQLKKECQPEILKARMINHQYDEGIEMAFRFHLMEPDDMVYVYYVMEFIRRACYLDQHRWTKHFITDMYFKKKEDVRYENKIAMDKHLFEGFDLEIMCMSPEQIRKINARFYWETLKFDTYEQAFVFFEKLGRAINCTECLLSNALSLPEKQESRKKLLSEYLSKPDALHKNYAEMLLKGNLEKSFVKKKMLVYHKFIALVKQGKEYIPISTSGPDDLQLVDLLYDSVSKGDGERKVLSMRGLKKEHLDHYILLDKLRAFGARPTFSKGRPVKMYLLDPEYADLFHFYGVNEMEFIHTFYLEYHKKENTVDAYQQASQITLADIFKQSRKLRGLFVRVVSVRIATEGAFKVRYKSEELKLKYKSVGLQCISSQIKYGLKRKGRYQRILDSRAWRK